LGGGSYYFGTQRSSWYGAYGGFATFDATEQISINGQMVYTQLSGKSSTTNQGFIMHLFEGDILEEYNFLSLYDGKHIFTPFITVGLGLTGNLSLDSTQNNGNSGTSFIIPLGAGGKFLLNKNVQLRLEYQQRIPVGVGGGSYYPHSQFGSYGIAQVGISIRLSSLLAPGRYE
jgi:hypothetical protein